MVQNYHSKQNIKSVVENFTLNFTISFNTSIIADGFKCLVPGNTNPMFYFVLSTFTYILVVFKNFVKHRTLFDFFYIGKTKVKRNSMTCSKSVAEPRLVS